MAYFNAFLHCLTNLVKSSEFSMGVVLTGSGVSVIGLGIGFGLNTPSSVSSPLLLSFVLTSPEIFSLKSLSVHDSIRSMPSASLNTLRLARLTSFLCLLHVQNYWKKVGFAN